MTAELLHGTPPFVMRQLDLAAWFQYLDTYVFRDPLPTKIILHHTAIPDQYTWRGLATLAGIQRFYAGKGWSAGPHLFVDTDVYLATPLRDVGIHANAANGLVVRGKVIRYSIGLEAVWNGDRAPLGGDTRATVIAVLGSLCRRLGLPPTAIEPHRTYNRSKTCPGRLVQMPDIWRDVSAWLAATTPRSTWQVRVTASDGLRIRQWRGTDAPIHSTLAAGAVVTVDDDRDGWLHLADQRGFIAKSFTALVS